MSSLINDAKLTSQSDVSTFTDWTLHNYLSITIDSLQTLKKKSKESKVKSYQLLTRSANKYHGENILQFSFIFL